MSDEEFSADYLLTVFPFSMDVFLYVSSALVDLSVFGSDQTSLIRSLQSAHRSLRFRPLPQQRKATIQGPFAAVQTLRHDLIRRAAQLKPTDSAQTSQESPLNPRVISHPEFVDSVSCSRSKAKPAPVNGLSTGLQTTGEATRVQSRLLNAKTVNASRRLRVQERGFAEGGFSDTGRDEEEEESSQSRAGMQTELRDPGQFKEGKHTGRCLQDAAEISANGNQSSSAASSRLHQTTRKDVSNSADVENPPEETCTWVDLNTYRYIRKFAKKELSDCLRGLHASFKRVQESDLVRVVLTETSEATSGIQQALEGLQCLMESWMTTLRVHEIEFDEKEGVGKEEVTQICRDVNLLFDDVMCVFEGSCVKVIGPSVSSHLFHKIAEGRISKLKNEDVM
ncbi:uncharacterized protein LOC141786057 isoform X2 [Halichoeres trimaculatus]